MKNGITRLPNSFFDCFTVMPKARKIVSDINE